MRDTPTETFIRQPSGPSIIAYALVSALVVSGCNLISYRAGVQAERTASEARCLSLMTGMLSIEPASHLGRAPYISGLVAP